MNKNGALWLEKDLEQFKNKKMIRNKFLNSLSFLVLFILLCYQDVIAQKIDTDSLLTVIIKDMRTEKNYQTNIKRALLGKKIAPNYLDYYLMLGRNYDLSKNKDSARFYYKYYIQKSSVNEDAFNYLINLELETQNYDNAESTIDQAIKLYRENINFEKKKLALFQLQKDTKREYDYLKILQLKNPNDAAISQLIIQLESKFKSDRFGVNYSFTNFDRKGYGPWNLLSLQYIHERQWGSLIGRINYANRLSSGQTISNGIQYELESYFFTGKNNYSYAGAAYSKDLVFPKLRLAYSFFQNFKKGWEGDIGIRYIQAQDDEITTLALGAGKYIGSYWFNFRTFIQSQNKDFYPAISLNVRYYFDSRFDYISLASGYGSSPEDRAALGQFKQRLSLDSYRFGAGYSKIFNNHYIAGIQLNYNNQEYLPKLKQNEFEVSLMLQYKL